MQSRPRKRKSPTKPSSCSKKSDARWITSKTCSPRTNSSCRTFCILTNLCSPANCVSCPSPLAGASRVSKKSSATPGSKTSAPTSLFPPRNISTAMKTLVVKTNRRTQFVDITREVEQAVRESGVKSGVCHVYVPHTTAGVVINEHADPDVASDVEGIFDRLIPHKVPYRHGEGNTDSHMKAILTGTSQSVFIETGKHALGTWQGIFLCAFDGPRQRTVFVKIAPDLLCRHIYSS